MAKLDEQPTNRKPHKATRASQNGPKSSLRGRDLIYIDTDDDVTSIVSRIKASEDAVVALVPPKRVGVLQSAVNMKLLQHAARTSKKHLAVVTTDPALINLAAGLGIPVAKNINAQAKVPEVADEEEISDVIDGSDIVVDNEPRRHQADEDEEIAAAVAAIETDDKIRNDRDADGIPDDEQSEPKKPMKKKIKVPNVNSLRKKVLLIGGAAVILIAFAVWAIIFAPHASITIQAKTSPVDVSKTLSLVPSGDNDAANGLLPPVVKQKKTNESVQFEATGTKEVGEKAKGTVAICNKQPIRLTVTATEDNIAHIPAGTRMYANGVQFVTDADVDVPGYSDDNGIEDRRVCISVKATAVNIGSEYNVSDGTLMQISGFNQNAVAAEAEGDFTGGSKETVKVVQQSDVDAAVAKLNETGDSDAARDELTDQMADSTIVIANSFSVAQGDVKVSPAVGETANGQATASVEVTYTLVGVNRDDLNDVLNAQLNEQVDTGKQKIYDNGLDGVEFSNFQATDSGYTVTVETSGHVGPVINEDDVKKEATGKKSEEIKSLLQETDGVEDVNVTMSPFWVSTAPAANKIDVSFEVDE